MAVAYKRKEVIEPRPILKWAGGKQQLVDKLLNNVPTTFGKYIEPFIGGGALFFALQPFRSVIADINPDLINLYRTVVSDVEEIIEQLKVMENSKDLFYEIRSQDVTKLSSIERAVRTIYLNRTCYNGLYRVNRRGEFNVPFGYYKNPLICDEANLRKSSIILSRATIINGDYKTVLRETASQGDLVYLDPPYLPVSKYSDFKRYSKEQFYEDDHRELAEEVIRLHELGCHVLLTNSNHPLVHELYGKYNLQVFNTKRYINCDAKKRSGEDVLVKIEPKRNLQLFIRDIELPNQMNRFPSTRFMGSKQSLLNDIWKIASRFDFHSMIDLFSGSGVVGYMMKTQGKQVITNDYMAFSACLSRALIQNSHEILSQNDIEFITTECPTDDFVSKTFQGLYFSDEDNHFIDIIRMNINKLCNPVKKDLATTALIRACLKKRPRGIFTYTGFRYDDGRKDLRMTLQEQFHVAVQQINSAVFDNGQENHSFHVDALNLKKTADLIYIDPPYYSPLSDNEYIRRYHFLEGLALDWRGVEIQEHTVTKKFKSYPTPFSTASMAYDAFEKLFKQYKNSILLVSYSSNSLPTQDQMIELLSKYKDKVEVIEIDHRYSFGNQGHKVSSNKNKVQEYIFIGY